ncbi:MAG: metal-dependent hydrolase [Flavisolibacter sp.]
MTHIVLGACIGEALAGKQLGKKAMLLGALAQSLPDIDFLAALWNDPASNLLAHRGFTHSFLFGILATVLLALLALHYQQKSYLPYKRWLLFFGRQIGTHLFLDLFNSYGMGLLEPFSHRRYSFNALFVADPFFSIWPGLSFLVLLFLKGMDPRRGFWWRFGLAASSLYLLYCSFNKAKIDQDARTMLARQGIAYSGYFTTPVPLNNWLWYVVAKQGKGFYIGYRSVFDRTRQMELHYFPQNANLLDSLAQLEEVQHLLRFSQGFYTMERWHDTLVFNDLRFGQMIGWYDPHEHFVFHYFLHMNASSNKLVVQRGRFALWDWQTTRSLIRRIEGD